jgi:hypothetical protein
MGKARLLLQRGLAIANAIKRGLFPQQRLTVQSRKKRSKRLKRQRQQKAGNLQQNGENSA